jgi:hypothetical protein
MGGTNVDDQQPLRTRTYNVWVMDAAPVGAEARTEREWLSGLMLSDQERADRDELDGILIEQTLAGEVLPEVLADLPARPLDHWWWHLGAIHDRSYPADLLPAPLRAIYLERSAD